MGSSAYDRYQVVNPNAAAPTGSRYDKVDKPDYEKYDRVDPIVENFDDSLEVESPPVKIHVDMNGPARQILVPPVPFPNNKPPTPPPKGMPLDPKVDYNRVVARMKTENLGEQARGVEYVGRPERDRYRIDMGARMTRDGALFDTKTIKTPYVQAGEVYMQRLDDSTDAQYHEWGGKSCIWVCFVPEGEQSVSFYSHVCRGGKFHHSSFSKGGEVVGAGEWIVEGGKLKKISANSGHYQPTIDFLYRSVLHMASARQPDTTIFLWDRAANAWVDRPWKDFIESPSAGGRYWPHKNAVK